MPFRSRRAKLVLTSQVREKFENISRSRTEAVRRVERAKIVLAYADEEAGEVGTVYQATNWLYLGQTNPRNRNSAYIIDDVKYDPRTALKKFGSASKKKIEAEGHTFVRVKRTAKHQYVHWIGTKIAGRFWKKQLVTYPYPKRPT